MRTVRPPLLTSSNLLVASGLLVGLPPGAALAYLLVTILLPVVLIVFACRGATPAQRGALVRAYLGASSLGRGRGECP